MTDPSPSSATPSPPSQEILVAVAELTRRFGSFVAVDRLSLEIARGEIVALLGPNGAGKTTTIRMLMGMLAPSSGSARIAGHDCFAARPRVMEHVGYLPDEPFFHQHLRGGEIARFCGDMRGMPRELTVERTRVLAERLALTEALDDFAVNYSMGMRKKLALVCAMLHEPDVLILDDPTNGLDPIATRALLALVRETAMQGRAVFYSTHLLHQAERLCDRVAILGRGRLVASGTPAELRALHASGASLEDVFFQVAVEPNETVDPDGAAGPTA
jgi:ABC-2 type transport system ATP-binding protein